MEAGPEQLRRFEIRMHLSDPGTVEFRRCDQLFDSRSRA
jgi:hypothetical protein